MFKLPLSSELPIFIELSEAASHHVNKVLRMTAGQKLIIFSEENQEFDAVITSIDKKKVFVSIVDAKSISRESPCSIQLIQAISKGDRMEWVIQKAVELGVFSITPLLTARTVVKLDKCRMEKKLAQWRAIAVAACEQSGRNQLPKINAMLTLDEYLKASPLEDQLPLIKFVLDPEASKSWRDYSVNKESITLLVGPEGGFSKEEMENIFAAGFNSLSLGPRILRTETAAIASLSILQAIWGDL